MIILLLGAPGAGKGTQAALLNKKYGLKHISTGDLLREEIKNNTPVGKKAAAIMESGALVPDDMILGLLKNALNAGGKGIILDGYPRTAAQARELDRLIKAMGEKIKAVVNIKLSEEEIVNRIIMRRQCKKCGNIFNLRFMKNFDGKCPKCGSGDVYQRPDDNEAAAKHRLEVYRAQTAPVVEFFKDKDFYKEVDGIRPAEKVFEEISKFIEK
ncbi:MAG: adenylate kinase [Elusimicrobium sp.]|jgi:adenylate kinase|nr:adenylate kinase [Elusimicrobium sp.]